MSESFLVEVWGEPAGYVLPEGSAFRFHALTQPFSALDGAQFTKPGHARIDYEYTLYPISPDPQWTAASQTVDFTVSGTVTENHGEVVWAGR